MTNTVNNLNAIVTINDPMIRMSVNNSIVMEDNMVHLDNEQSDLVESFHTPEEIEIAWNDINTLI